MTGSLIRDDDLMHSLLACEDSDPTTYEEASKHKEWRIAMDK